MAGDVTRPWGRKLAVLVTGVLALAGLVGLQPARAGEQVPVINPPEGGGPIEYETVLYGPFDLDAMGTGHWQDEGNDLVPRPDGGYGLKSIVFDVVDESGNSLPKHALHLHHFVLATIGQQDPACPGRHAPGFPDVKVHPHLGTGAERTPIAIQDPYAMRVLPNEEWGATWHLMNMTDSAQRVYVKYTIGLQRGATSQNTRWVTPWFMDVEGSCGGAEYDIPGDGGPGSVSHRTNSWTVPEDGIAVGTGAHLHAGGIATELRDGDGGLICRSEANYAGGVIGHHTMESISPCFFAHHSVSAGETLQLDSIYDNSRPWEDVMGINLTFFWFGDQGDPPVEPPDPDPSSGVGATDPTAPAADPAQPATAVAAVPATVG